MRKALLAVTGRVFHAGVPRMDGVLKGRGVVVARLRSGLSSGVPGASSGNASSLGPHEKPMKAALGSSRAEDRCGVFVDRLRKDMPGDADPREDWKRAENANPCE